MNAASGKTAYPEIVGAWERYDVVLADSLALATALNSAKAESDRAGAFGVVATTFNAWIDGLWEQHGDGRRFVSQPFAVLVMRLMLDEGCAGDQLADTPNLPIAAEKCASRGAGIAAFESALLDHSSLTSLSAAEHALLDFLAEYRNRLHGYGLVERGSAVAWLASQAHLWCADKLAVCYVSDAPLPVLVQEFFEVAGSQLDFTHLATDGTAYQNGPAPVASLPDDATVSFALPAGYYANAQVLAQIIEHAAPEGPVIIAAKDPLATYESLANAFDELELRSAMRARVPFARTHVGGMYTTLHEMLVDAAGQGSVLAAVDMLRAPLFGVRAQTVQKLHDQVLCNRLVKAEDMFEAMAAKSGVFGHFVALLVNPSQDDLDAMHKAVDESGGYSPAQKREMQQSFDVLGSFLLGAVELGVPEHRAESLVFPLLSGTQVPASRANYPANVGQFPDVLVLGQRQASILSPGQCATMVVWDLNNVDYPATRRDNAVSTFLSHVGVEEPDELQNMQRRTFAALIELPSRHVVLGRCLRDADMKELYPAAMLEEFLDVNGIEVPKDEGAPAAQAPAGDGSAPAGDGRASAGASPATFPALFAAGEDDLVADALGSNAPWDLSEVARAQLEPGDARLAWLSKIYQRRSADGTDATASDGLPCESPSHLEVYHECPRKWFVTRWLNVERPGEGFGPMERGSFIHQCVQTFYERFQRNGHAKIDEANRDQARELMEQVVEDVRVLQYEIEPGGFETRYVAVPGMPSEEAQYLRISRGLASAWVDAEAALAAGTTFVPVLFEYPIDQLGAVLGGVAIKGRVDRIDIDEAGNLLVIDYKGTIGPEHQGPGETLAGKKIQTLLYAAAIRRAGRLEAPDDATPLQVERVEAFNARCSALADNPACVSGAVYFSYNERPASGLRTAGFFCKGSPLTAENLLFAGKDPDAFAVEAGAEDAFFASIEDVVANVIAGQRAGRIGADLPVDAQGDLLSEAKGICAYCPDMFCERRAV